MISFKSPLDPSIAYVKAYSSSESSLTTLCTFPELDIKGYITQGIPIASTADLNS